MPTLGALVRERLQPFAASHRILLYVVCSILALAITTFNALRDHSNFYSVAIHLSRSSRSLLVLANSGMCTAFVSGQILQSVFFGPLLPAEVERLYDRTWFFITESLLAFTIFRDDFDIPFGVMFGFLLFVKCFHWLLADRIEWMDQRPYPGPPPIFHIRVLGLFTLLTLTDLVMLAYTVDSTLNHGVSATLLFANEYAILVSSVCNAMAKYALGIYELRRAASRGGAQAPPWEAKSMYVFYIELLTDFCKLTTYLAFFAIIMTLYGLPLNLIREVYVTGHSFVTRLAAFQRYRAATRDMDERYPNATAEELSGESDHTCIICREEMVVGTAEAGAPPPPTDGPNMTPKKLPCGHIFHFYCLRSWLERQQKCPTCRRTVLEEDAPQNGEAARPQANNGLPLAPQVVQGQQRPWGLFAQQQQQQAQARGGAGRRDLRGLLGRLFGPAAEPAPVPAQAPAQAPAPGLGQAQGPGAGARAEQRPPALVFQYNYVWDGNAREQRLMQPPLLQGFYREDGLWQGWPNGGALPVERPAQPAGAVSEASAGTSAPAAPMPVTAPERAANDGSAPGAGEAPSASTASGAATPVSRAATPRDAAGAAALRRFALQPRTRSALGTPTGETAPSVPPLANDSATASSASAHASSDAPAATPTSTRAPSAAVAPTSERTPLPTYIPLYDFAMSPSNRHGASQGSAPHMGPVAGAATTPGLPRTPAAARTPMAIPMPRSFSMPRGLVPGTPGTPQPGAPALNALPRTLGDAELARLDALTRDAIDARLRVLEDVGGAVHRCIDELLRVRSVLPPAAAAATGGSAPPSFTLSHPSPAGPQSSAKGKAVDPTERSNAWVAKLNNFDPPEARAGPFSPSTVGAEPSSPSARSSSFSGTATFSELDADEQLVADVDNTPNLPAAAVAPDADVAASAAAQLSALAALVGAAPTADAAPDADAASAPGALPPPSGQVIEVEPEAVPLAVIDPALEQTVGAQALGEGALLNVGGQQVADESSEEEDEEEEEEDAH